MATVQAVYARPMPVPTKMENVRNNSQVALKIEKWVYDDVFPCRKSEQTRKSLSKMIVQS